MYVLKAPFKISIFSTFFLVWACFGQSDKEVNLETHKEHNIQAVQATAEDIDAYLILKDPLSAIDLCKKGLELDPESPRLLTQQIKALRRLRDKNGLIHQFNILKKSHEHLTAQPILCEELAWGILEWGAQSNQEAVKQMALIGSALSRQSEGVRILEKALYDPSLRVRYLATLLVQSARDAQLEKALIERLYIESEGAIRLLTIEALGSIGGEKALVALKRFMTQQTTSYTEKSAAQKALIHLTKSESSDEIIASLKAKEPDLRAYGCILAMHLDMRSLLPEIVKLFKDPSHTVRLSALFAACSLSQNSAPGEESNSVLSEVKKALKDRHPDVQLVAARLLIPEKDKEAVAVLKKWLYAEHLDFSRKAASIIKSCGKSAQDLAQAGFLELDDLEVKVLLAQALLIQRKEVESAGQFLSDLILKQAPVLSEQATYGFFEAIVPSSCANPFMALSQDLGARLSLIDLVVASGYSQAYALIEPFLQSQKWGSIFGIASMLMKEEPSFAIDKISEFLDHKNLQVRAQAAMVCTALRGDEKARGVLEEVFKNPKASRELKLHALEALMHCPGKRDTHFFIESLSTPYEVLQLALAGCILSALNH